MMKMKMPQVVSMSNDDEDAEVLVQDMGDTIGSGHG
jgi:hypothetical protein